MKVYHLISYYCSPFALVILSYSTFVRIIIVRVLLLSPETWFFHSRSCLVKTSFGQIPSIEQSKGDISIPLISQNSFTIYYGPAEKCKALYTNSVNCILVSIVNFIYHICFAQYVEQDRNWFFYLDSFWCWSISYGLSPLVLVILVIQGTWESS